MSVDRLITVGLVTKAISAGDLIRRHTPDEDGRWRGCRFEAFRAGREYDWVVVLHQSVDAPLTVLTDPNHVVYVSMEPHECNMPDGFLAQFARVVLTDPRVHHPGLVRANGQTWFVGAAVQGAGAGMRWNLSYRDLVALRPPERRARRISVVTSTQTWMPGHRLRNRLLRSIERHPIGRFVDVFGDGRRGVVDKLDAILPNRYHLALENAIIPGYWSEKLADALIGHALPIYGGCPDVERWFASDALVPIDLACPRHAIGVLEQVLDEDPYDERLDAISVARRSVLEDHNLFSLIDEICDEPAREVQQFTLAHPGRYLRGGRSPLRQRLVHRAYGLSAGAMLLGRPAWRLPPRFRATRRG